MSLPIVFRRAAESELDEAVEWYEQRQTGRGIKFSAAVQHVLDQIALNPDLCPIVYQEVREALVAKYPYCVYYQQEPQRLLVVSIFHSSRDPSVWKKRV